jgi:starch synthase
MKILFAASECVPFIKTGGLADVIGALAPVLAKMGHDVRVIIPKYSAIPDEHVNQMQHVVDFEVELGWRKQYCGIEQLQKNGVTYYYVDNRYYFGRNYIYGLAGDEYERFAFFSRSVLNSLPLIGFMPDVLHAHDWQAGMIPALLRIQYAHLPDYANIKTVMTIHNLRYQGVFGVKEVQDVLGLGDSLFTDDKLEFFGAANFLKAGIVYADEVTTVSPSYSEEIQTAYYGERLDGLLRAKKDHLHGILNGLDIVDYDPEHDKYIAATYSAGNLEGKKACKKALQEQLGLEVREDAPIIAMVSRLSNQKGLDLVDYVIADIMRQDVQLVCLGMGDSRYVNLFSWAEQNYPGRVAARFVMDHALAHQVYAGADIFLMPSQFEPCGLSQMIALRYGTLPIVRETGGLRDTVLSYNEFTGEGNGFSFFNYNAHDMLHTIERALDYYWHKPEIWAKIQERGMSTDFSWDRSANAYIDLYSKLIGSRKEKPVPKASEKATGKPSKTETKPTVQEKPVKAKAAAKKSVATKAVETEAEEAKAPAKPVVEEKPSTQKPVAKKTVAKKAVTKEAEIAEEPKRKVSAKKVSKPKAAADKPKKASK